MHKNKIFSRKNWLAIGLVSAMACGMASSVQADTDLLTLNIESQKLATALLELGQVAGVEIVIPQSSMIDAKQVELKGNFSLNQALDMLLRGSGLSYQFTSDTTVVVKAADSQKQVEQKNSYRDKFAMDEIIVTAEKREESAQSLPIAISAFTGESLKSAGIEGVRNLQQLSPSLQFGKSGPADTFVSIRGIGAELPNIGAETGVTIAQDGVPFLNQLMFDARFMDTERVEVLRGPQGTISGRNATGGAINIYSRRPTEEFEGAIKAAVGNYNRSSTEGYLSGPLMGGQLLGRLAFNIDRADGWLINTFRDEDQNTTDVVHARSSVQMDMGDKFETYLILEGMIDRSSKASVVEAGRARPDLPSRSEFYNLPGFDSKRLEYQADFDNRQRTEAYKTILKLTWDMAPTTTLVSTSSYMAWDRESLDDFDALIYSVGHQDIDHSLWQMSQELTLTTDISNRLDLILGVMYLRANAKEPIAIEMGELDISFDDIYGTPEQDLTSYGAYTQLRFQLTDVVRLTVGGRYTYDEKRYESEGYVFGPQFLSGDDSWEAFTPRAAVDYTPTGDLTVFASASRGFKAGGFNTFQDPVKAYNPEFVWSYEVGLKAKFFDDRVRVSTSAFYMDYVDLQQNVFGFDLDGDGISSPQVLNAGTAEIQGVELELEALVTDRFRVNFSGTWLDAKFVEMRNADNVFPELGVPDSETGENIRDLSGNRLPRAPEWRFAVAGKYAIEVGDSLISILSANYSWQSEVFFSVYNHERVSQEAYGLLNLRAAIESDDGRWSLSAYVHNLLDERYFVNTFTSGAGAFVVPDHVGAIGEPRMYGLSLAYKLGAAF